MLAPSSVEGTIIIILSPSVSLPNQSPWSHSSHLACQAIQFLILFAEKKGAYLNNSHAELGPDKLCLE